MPSAHHTGDLAYLLSHPIARVMYKRCAELKGQAQQLPDESFARKAIERRISKLEEYILPRPNTHDFAQTRQIKNQDGVVIGVSQSLRRRFKDTRRGRPELYRVQTLAALEEKIANSRLTWRELAKKHGFKDTTRTREDGTRVHVDGSIDLQRAACRLKQLLRAEGIPLPT